MTDFRIQSLEREIERLNLEIYRLKAKLASAEKLTSERPKLPAPIAYDSIIRETLISRHEIWTQTHQD